MRKAQDWSLVQCDYRAMGYSPAEIIQTQVAEGAKDIDFLRILKKEHVEIPGVIMKNLWNFYWSWFLTLESSAAKGITQFCRIRRGESLFSKSRVTYLKIQGFFSENYIQRSK